MKSVNPFVILVAFLSLFLVVSCTQKQEKAKAKETVSKKATDVACTDKKCSDKEQADCSCKESCTDKNIN